jgi:hypothetical protein
MIFKYAKFQDGVYNRAVCLPPALVAQFVGRFSINYSKHARHAARDDRYGYIALKQNIEIRPEDIVQIQVEGGRVKQALVRQSYDENFDICIPVQLEFGNFLFGITCWLNEKSDQHQRQSKDHCVRLAA